MQRQVFSQQFHHLFLIDMGESGNFSRKVYLAAGFAPPYELAVLFMHICEAAGAATDIPMLAGRVAKDGCKWSKIPWHHLPRAHESKCPDIHTPKDDPTP